MIGRYLAGGLMLMTMGCAPLPPSEPSEDEVPPEGAGRCDAGPAQALVGREASAELGAEALRLSGAVKLRWIRPGMMVTMDYREDRLNVELDDTNKVTKVRCG